MACRKLVVLILALGCATAGAEDRWVTDEFEVMMRSGKNTRQSIVRQLKSGTRVELLEADSESGYTRVRTGSGAVGWVLSRYLRSSPTAQLRLPDLERRLAASEAQRATISNELAVAGT